MVVDSGYNFFDRKFQNQQRMSFFLRKSHCVCASCLILMRIGDKENGQHWGHCRWGRGLWPTVMTGCERPLCSQWVGDLRGFHMEDGHVKESLKEMERWRKRWRVERGFRGEGRGPVVKVDWVTCEVELRSSPSESVRDVRIWAIGLQRPNTQRTLLHRPETIPVTVCPTRPDNSTVLLTHQTARANLTATTVQLQYKYIIGEQKVMSCNRILVSNM